ncbi:MAG: hypothetical protein ACREC9_09040 [Methylocella sp.]
MKYASVVFMLSVVISMGSAWAEGPQSLGTDSLKSLQRIAFQSKCASHSWKHGRGLAPRSYIEGVALVFARAVCHPDRSDTQIVSAPMSRKSDANDALAVYEQKFAAAGMINDKAGVDTLRHSYTLLIGLGMMESSGKYCEGRDVSQCFAGADDAEAGLFQTSYGAHIHSLVLDNLFKAYKSDQNQCLLNIFHDSLTCRIVKSHNPKCPSATSDVAGTGDGADWQRLTKDCPAFATEYGAVVLRTNGGRHGEFNPIRKQQAELRPECDSMLQSVQSFVGHNPEICSAL